MIRINLLPVRDVRKKENVRRQVSIFLLCVVFGLCVMGYLTISMNRTIRELDRNIGAAEEDLKKYQAIEKQVAKMRDELRILEDKMNIIVQLEANRTIPFLLVDALSTLVVDDKMWLESFTEKGNEIRLAGVATDNKTVADFMTRLETTALFNTVDLISSKQVDLKQDKKFKRFSITCQPAGTKPLKPAETS